MNIQNESWKILTKMQVLLYNPMHDIFFYNINKDTHLIEGKVM